MTLYWQNMPGTYLCGLVLLFIYLGFLRRFQHCTGHITTGSWKGRGNQYIQVLYCKLPSNYQLSHLRPCREPNPGLRDGRRECYHSVTVAPVSTFNIDLKVVHVPGKLNVVADLLSRWFISTNNFQKMQHLVNSVVLVPESNALL